MTKRRRSTRDERPKVAENERPSVAETQTNMTASDLEGGNNLAQVRDILFGSQMRDVERRFARLQDRLAQDVTALREEIGKRAESLELFVKNQLESIADKVKAEHADRVAKMEKLSGELKEMAGTLDSSNTSLREDLERSAKSLREHALEQTTSLRDELQKKNVDLSTRLEREASELRESKADRAALGDLFKEIGLRLSRELDLPRID